MNKSLILDALKRQKNTYFGERELMKMLCREIGEDSLAIKAAVRELLESGEIIETERYKYALTERSDYIKGTFVGNSKGFGFVEPTDRTKEDLFIPERSVNGAFHGDTVLARLAQKRLKGYKKFNSSEGNRKEAEIVKVLKRGISILVGTYTAINGGGVVKPDDARIADQVFVSMDKTNNARTNEKVVLKLTCYPSRNEMAMGEILEVLGNANDLGVDTLSIVRSFGLFEKFPDNVLEEAKKVAVEPTAKDIKGRTDFTKDLVFTIDGEDAKDFDDAISLTKNAKGYLLKVHIADVSNYVRAGSALDSEAYNRATSVYFPDMVIPMLPVELSNDVCSLNPNVLRLTLSVVMQLDKEGNILDYQITNGAIVSKYRMTYTKVSKIFAGDKALCKEYKELVPMLLDMKELAELLIKRRDNAGELDFDLPEVQIDVDENKKIVDIYRKPRGLADRLIEQFMVVTNEVVARYAKDVGLPFIYRVHEVPTPERIKAFNDFVRGVGLNLTIAENEPKPKDVQKVLVTIKDTSAKNVISSLLLRSMQKARYYELPLGHFGLALADYCHFTSPIRRLPDLIIHRILKASLAGELDSRKFEQFEDFVHNASEQASARERLADDAERAVDDLKKTEYMSKKIGEIYDGVISGVTQSGFYVALENTVEGFVREDTLPTDNYYYDERKMAFIGKKHKFMLGGSVKIKVANTNLQERKIDFELVE